jgi:hypothetical protein
MRARRRGIVRATALGLGSAALAVLAVLPSAAAKAPAAKLTAPATASGVVAGAAQVIYAPTVLEIKRHLRSLGIDPRGVVIQRGAKNYAGPNCPGAAWNCTTAKKVVQISSRTSDDDENRYLCRRERGAGTESKDPTPPEQSCVVVQPGGARNLATCEIRTSGTTTGPTGPISQTCSITQGGAQNTAVARLVAVMGAGTGEQDVVQRIEIRQTGGAKGNSLTASQTALLGLAKNAGGANVLAKQDFHQIVCGNQTASGSGTNTASVTQHGAAGVLYSNAGFADIRQNRELLSLDCTTAAPFANITGEHADEQSCAVEGGSGVPKDGANSCSRIQQQSSSGRNRINRQNQTNLLAASVNGAAGADIGQGLFAGGIDATQDQVSGGVSSIVDSQRADQFASLRNVSGSQTVTQVEDPRCCAHQLGNTGNTFSLGQTLNQRAYVNGELVDPGTVGGIVQNGADYGNCVSTGSCSVQQSVSNNVETETNSCSGSVCHETTSCTAGGGSAALASGPAVVQQEGVCFTEDTEPPANPNCVITQDRSISGDTPSEITFDNQSGETVSIYWLDYEGNRVLYNAELGAGTSYTQPTWITHPWVAIAGDESCLGYTISDQPSKTYVIQPRPGD